MDDFRQDSAHVTSSFSSSEPAGSTLEDRIARRLWARGALAFYAFLFLAGATATARETVTSSSGTEHVSLRTDVRSNQ
jgi:hypothetical protein